MYKMDGTVTCRRRRWYYPLGVVMSGGQPLLD